MKHFIALMILMAAAWCANAGVRVVVVDQTDNSPVSGATVMEQSGVIAGLTDDSGAITAVGRESFPLTIRCMGYEPANASAGTDTVRLQPSVYRLNEIVVTPAGRPITRVVCFAREYNSGITGGDTMQYYCEYMAEAFISEGKVKGYRGSDARPTAKAYKRYARIAREGHDSVFRPKRGDDIAEFSWFEFMAFLPTAKTELTDAMKNGAQADTIFGKYGPQFILRKKNSLFTKTTDILSSHKDRRWSPFLFKLLGMTVDIDGGNWSLTYADNGSDTFGIHDFISGTYNIHLIGKGRWLKKIFHATLPIEMNSYLEIYPVETTFCTVEEYREMRDDFNPLPFQSPAGLQPLSPSVEQLIERAGGL